MQWMIYQFHKNFLFCKFVILIFNHSYHKGSAEQQFAGQNTQQLCLSNGSNVYLESVESVGE